jgi:hypothetical protein
MAESFGCDQKARPAGSRLRKSGMPFLWEQVAGRGGRLYAATGTTVTAVPLRKVTVTNDPRRRRERLSVLGGVVTKARVCFAFAANSLTPSRNKKHVG